MRSLIAKEWRENRLLVLGLLVLAPLASLGFKWLAPGWAWRGLESTGVLLPGLLGLFTLAIAADLVGADAGSGRIRFLAALPVRPATVWAAKLAFLVLSAALYLGYCLTVEVAIFLAAGRSPRVLFAAEASANDWLLLVIAAGGAATLFWSTIVDRGLAAAIAGAGTVAAIGFGLAQASKAGLDFSPRSENFGLVALVATGGFLAGSFLAFTRGRIHLGSRLRRALLATGAFLLVTVPPTAWAGHAVHRHRTIRPGDTDLSVTFHEASPHEPWVFVMAERRVEGPFGVRAPAVPWAVRTTDGLVRELPGTCWPPEFPAPGRVVLHRFDPVPGERRHTVLRIVYDLDRGAIESTRPETAELTPPPIRYGHHLIRFKRPIAVLAPDGSVRATLGDDRMPVRVTAPWGLAAHRWAGGRSHMEVVALDGGATVALPSAPLLLPERRDGCAWRVERMDEAASLRRFRLDGSPGEVMLSGHCDGFSTSWDCRFAIVLFDGRAFLLRADRDTAEEIPGAVLSGRDVGVHWAEHEPRALLVSKERAMRVTVGEQSCVAEAVRLAALPGVHNRGFFDGERLILCDGELGTLDCYDLSGGLRRLLPTR